METEVLATLLGVALAALVAACGAGFKWMRSEFNERFDRLEGRVDRLDVKIDRLEAKVDSLIMALARSGVLVDHPSAEPGLPPPDPPTLEAGGGGAVA
ncbi:MAG: hypothetical protein F4Z34_09250 [Acidimicrobiaceae bacterium]|nr:hypothetical protein [Acidimicrobiaceae bacterium]MYB28967.1 hypothetical protein [Acidimicrobiaceae bacterium]